MATNINVSARRKQLAILVATVVAASAIGGLVWYFGQDKPVAASSNANAAPMPNMTGVVTSSFTDKEQQSALTQQQNKVAALENSLAKVTDTVSQVKESQQKTLEMLQESLAQNEQMRKQLQGSNSAVPTANGGAGISRDAQGNPIPAQLSGTPATPPAQYSVTNPPAGAQGVGFYPGGSAARVTGTLKSTTFTYASSLKKNNLPYIPSGSFSDAVMIEGADANASVTGSTQTTPVEFRLSGKVQLPNSHEYSMEGCFVTAEIWGDISSERGTGRTRNISCNLKNGQHIDQKFEGHFAYQGKEGIRGKPVMRNGKIIGYAGAAGFLSGIGAGISSAATPSVGLGATASVGGGDILKQGFGGGAEKAADTLSQYWIKRAEQYHPVIDIGAGNPVTIVFQEGFQLETIEEDMAKKAAAQVQTASAQTATAVTNTVSSSVGNVNPDDVLRQARALHLGDTIN